MNRYLGWGAGVVILALLTLNVIQWRMIVQSKTQRTAIENPAKTEVRYVTRDVVRTVQVGGATREVIREIESTTLTSLPTVPAGGNASARLWYISGTAGVCTRGQDWDMSPARNIGLGAGINVFEAVSVGVRYDMFAGGEGHRVGVEARVEF